MKSENNKITTPKAKTTLKSVTLLCKKLILRREEEDTTQRKLSERMKVVYNHVNRLETDIKNGNLGGKTINTLANYAAELGYEIQFRLEDPLCQKTKKKKKKASKKSLT